MKRKSSFIVAASLITALLLAVTAGCSDPSAGKTTGNTGGNTGGKTGDVTAVKILQGGKEVKTTINAHAGNTVEFTAKVTATGGAATSVTWKVTGKKASETKIGSTTGVLTIGADEPIGTTLTVTATSTVKKTVSKTAKVKVIETGKPTELVIIWPDSPVGGSEDGSLSVNQGDILQLYAEDENGEALEVFWEIISEGHSEDTYIDLYTGELYIAEDETADGMTIRVTSMADEDLSSIEEIEIIKPTFNIAYGPFTGGNVTGPATAQANTNINLSITTNSGYTFSSITVTKAGGGTVTVNNGSGNNRSFTMPNANVSIAATFTRNQVVEPIVPVLFTITYGPFTNGNVTGPATAEANTNINLTITPNNGYTLQSITGSGGVTVNGSGNNRSFTMPNANVSITATFATTGVSSPRILYGTFTGGNVTGPANAAAGSTVTLNLTFTGNNVLRGLTVTTISGVNIPVNGTGNTRTFTMANEHVEVAAVFEAGVAANTYHSEDFNTSLCSFFDKFDGTGTNLNKNGVDKAKWGFENKGDGFGNGEAQYYRGEENAVVQNGILSLILKKENYSGRGYTSAKLVTVNTAINPGQQFSQTYGRFEARIRLVYQGSPRTAIGLWPAFWMMPRESAYGGWPRSGEIDIMEMKGRLPRESSSTIHTKPPGDGWNSMYKGANYNMIAPESTSDWHVYGVQWTEEELIFLVDGFVLRRLHRTREPDNWRWPADWYNANGHANRPSAPFDRDFYPILNLAVGGGFDSNGQIDDTALPASLDIDWIRCYTLATVNSANFPAHLRIQGDVPANKKRNY